MPREIAVTFDYRCPFARNGHEAVVDTPCATAPTSTCGSSPFSLDQVHVDEGEPPVWEREPGELGHRRRSRCCTASRCATPSPSSSSTRTSRCSPRATTTA